MALTSRKIQNWKPYRGAGFLGSRCICEPLEDIPVGQRIAVHCGRGKADLGTIVIRMSSMCQMLSCGFTVNSQTHNTTLSYTHKCDLGTIEILHLQMRKWKQRMVPQ